MGLIRVVLVEQMWMWNEGLDESWRWDFGDFVCFVMNDDGFDHTHTREEKGRMEMGCHLRCLGRLIWLTTVCILAQRRYAIHTSRHMH